METIPYNHPEMPGAAAFIDDDGTEYLRYRHHKWDVGSFCGVEYHYLSDTGKLEQEYFHIESLIQDEISPDNLCLGDRAHYEKLLKFLETHPEVESMEFERI